MPWAKSSRGGFSKLCFCCVIHGLQLHERAANISSAFSLAESFFFWGQVSGFLFFWESGRIIAFSMVFKGVCGQTKGGGKGYRDYCDYLGLGSVPWGKRYRATHLHLLSEEQGGLRAWGGYMY